MTALKTMALGAAVAGLALAGAGAASAQDVAYRPLTVQPQYAHPVQPGATYYQPAAPAYDPYHGSATVVTAPIHVAGTIATAPFRAINQVFPAHGTSPLVLIGGPTYLVGQLVAFPFRLAEAPFGGPNPFQY